MAMSIFQGIICSTLQPVPQQNVRILPDILSVLGKLPTSREDAEQWLRSAIAGINSEFPLSFEPLPAIDATTLFGDVVYTEIRPPRFTLSLELPQPGSSRKERLYGAIFRWESYRIKEQLVEYANTVKDNVLARKEIVNELVILRRNLSDVVFNYHERIRTNLIPVGIEGIYYENDLREIDRIMDDFIRVLFWLYYDISLTFLAILDDKDVIPPTDLCDRAIRAFPDNFQLYQKIEALFDISHSLSTNSIEEMKSSLPLLYAHRDNNINVKALSSAINSIEDCLYQDAFGASVDECRVSDIEKELRARFHETDDPRDVLDIIEDTLADLAELGISEQSTESVPAKLRVFLSKQKSVYERAVGQVLISKTKSTSKSTVKKRSKKSEINLPARKNIVFEKLSFMSAAFEGNKIMSDEDFSLLQEYCLSFVREGKIPQITKRLRVNLPAQHLYYTFYLMYAEMKKSCCMREDWVKLAKAIFPSLDSWDQETLEKRFSQAPKSYFDDIKQE